MRCVFGDRFGVLVVLEFGFGLDCGFRFGFRFAVLVLGGDGVFRRFDQLSVGLDAGGLIDRTVGRRGLFGFGFGFARLFLDRSGLVRADDRDLAGQFGDGDGVGVAPPPARLPPTGGEPIVPFFASNSATEIGRVL
ncbi:hypothetical protein [Mycolicibacterium vanbaalenii]|uniref:hypothetical protein n=1 Tax=Mycolicibacterium vanbaalenii TaxID=110539 RepID=UPI0021F29AA1|nr:hypothetical protein [Mycolicibacterium vanbaalenii]